MIIPKEQISVYCPHCQHLAFKIEKLDAEKLNYRILIKCKKCKGWIYFPNDSQVVMRRMIREYH